MRRPTILAGAAVLVALLVTAGVAGALAVGDAPAPAQTQQQAQLSDTITVSGAGQVQAEADRAVVTVGVVATGDEISAVRNDLSSNASRMRSALADAGIDDSQIRTGHYDISSQERYAGPREEGPTYRAIHSFTITVEDVDSVGQVIDTAVNNGASEIDGVRFTLSADRREQLREDALQDAMNTARNEASVVAGAEDLTIAGVDRISTTQYTSTPYRAETAALASGDGGTSIDSGPVTVSASVTVVYDTGG